jgi:hypothetical protein
MHSVGSKAARGLDFRAVEGSEYPLRFSGVKEAKVGPRQTAPSLNRERCILSHRQGQGVHRRFGTLLDLRHVAGARLEPSSRCGVLIDETLPTPHP